MKTIALALDAYVKAVDVMDWLKSGGELPPDCNIGGLAYDYSVGVFGHAVTSVFSFAAKDIVDRRALCTATKIVPPTSNSKTVHPGEGKQARVAPESYGRKLSSQLVETAKREPYPRTRGEVGWSKATPFKLNTPELEAACTALVASIYTTNDFETSIEADAYRAAIVKECLTHLDRIQQAGRDPNLVTRAVLYITDVYAIPPLASDTAWFRHVLSALLEVAVPNSGISPEGLGFLDEVRVGLFQLP